MHHSCRFILKLLLCLIIGQQSAFATLPQSFTSEEACSKNYTGSFVLNHARLAKEHFVRDLLTMEKLGNYQINREQSIESVTQRAGLYGPYYQVVRKKELPWFSEYEELNQTLNTSLELDPQGDPRTLFGISYKLANYLGFEYINDRTINIPNVDTINKRLDRLSARLVAAGHSPILWRFYEQDKLSTTEYLTGLTEYKVPIATPTSKSHWNHFIHDISFHLAIIFFPTDYEAYIAQPAKEYLSLLAELKNYTQTSWQALFTNTNPIAAYNASKSTFKSIHKEFLKQLRLNLVYNLDFLMGVFSVLSAEKQIKEEATHLRDIRGYIGNGFGYQHPIDESLGFLSKLTTKAISNAHLPTFQKYKKGMGNYLKELRKQNPHWHTQTLPEVDEFARDIDQRIEDIESQIPTDIMQLLKSWL